MKTCPACSHRMAENLLSCDRCGHWLAYGEDPEPKTSVGRRLWRGVAENYLLLFMVLAWVIVLYLLVKPIFQKIFAHPLGPFLMLVGITVLSIYALYRQLIMK
jgi:hypothetical protein